MQTRVAILDVPVDDVTEDEAVMLVDGYIRSGTTNQVITLNPEFIMSAQKDPSVLHVLQQARLSTPDGVGVLWAARLLGRPLRERVTGVALVERLAAYGAHHGWRFFLLGSAPGIAERAATILQQRYPGLLIAGTHAGTPHTQDEADIRFRIADTHTDILLVAYGHPNQELWLARNLTQLRVPVGIGVGGTFDEIVGVVPPAPLWMHRFGIKWLWRLLIQPSRYARIFTAVVVFPLAVLRHHWVSRIRT